MVHGQYDDDARRTEALARAEKMKKLFDQGCFKHIMKAVDKDDATKAEFKKECEKVEPELEQVEIDWLWAYLENMPDKWTAVPDAANAGW